MIQEIDNIKIDDLEAETLKYNYIHVSQLPDDNCTGCSRYNGYA